MSSYLGRHVTTTDTDEGLSNATSANQVACVYPAITQHGWATAMGLLCGKSGASSPTVELAVWNVSGGTPGSRRGYTASFTPTNTIIDATTGQAYTASFATPIQLYSGTQYALGFASTGAGLGWVMSAAANFSNGSGGYTQPTTFYFKNVSSQPPTNPMGYTSSSNEGVIDVWVVYTPNTAPTAAIVAPSGTTTSQTPTVKVSFSDAESSLGDKLNQYRIQVRRKSDQVSFWDATFSATSAEQTAAQTSQPYAGTALVAGTTYQLRAWVSDQFATASSWTAWTDFTVNAGGTVTVTGPTGKQNVNTGITFSAEWTHASSLSTQDVQIQLLQSGVVVQDSGSIAKTVVSSAAPGTPFTITWAQTGFSDLVWGTAYTFQIRGQDTGGVWSTYAAGSFSTDSAPGTPTGLAPSSSLPLSSPPTLTATIVDPDGDTVTATARVKGTPVVTNAAYAADLGGWTGSNSGDNAGATVAATRDVSVFASGGAKLAISASTAASGLVYHYENTADWHPCVVGESYTARATYQTDTANLHPRLQIRWYNSSRTLLSASTETDWSPATGTQYPRSFTATAPASAAFFRIALGLGAAASNVTGNVYVSAWSVDQGTRTKPSMSGSGSTFTHLCTTGTNDVFTISVTGTPTGGSFTVNVDGVTATINYNSTAAAAQTALQALSTVGSGNLTVTGGPLPGSALVGAWTNNYQGKFKNAPTIGTNSLTGGTSPTPSIAHTTSGVVGDLGAYGTYGWDCVGSDGALTGSYPAQASFVYSQGPTVTVTAPTAGATLTTNTPTVSWTATGQAKYQVTIYLHGTSTVVWDSGLVTDAVTQSIAVPSGYLHGSPSTSYDVVVAVTNAAPLTGTSAATQFTVAYSAPSGFTNFLATPTFANLDSQASSVLCSWDATTYPSNQFVQLILDRRDAGTSAGDASTVTVYTSTSPLDTSFVDYLLVPDHAYTYSLRQQVTQGTDVTESARVESSASVSLVGVVLCAATNGGAYRAVLSYASQRKVDHNQDTAVLFPWGSATPTILIGVQNYQKVTGSFTLVADSTAQASSYVAALRAMYSQRLIVCLRDERDRRIFGVITAFAETDQRLQTYQVDLEITECSFTEGVTLA